MESNEAPAVYEVFIIIILLRLERKSQVGYFAPAQTVCTRPLSVSRPGKEASQVIHAINHTSLGYAGGGGGHQK